MDHLVLLVIAPVNPYIGWRSSGSCNRARPSGGLSSYAQIALAAGEGELAGGDRL